MCYRNIHAFVSGFYGQNDIKHTPILRVRLFPIWYSLVPCWLIHWKPTSFKYTVLQGWENYSLKGRAVWNVAVTHTASGGLPKHIPSNGWLRGDVVHCFAHGTQVTSMWCDYSRKSAEGFDLVHDIVKGVNKSMSSWDGSWGILMMLRRINPHN